MYIRPEVYLKELKNRIDELKKELAEIEPIYEALLKAGVKEESSDIQSMKIMIWNKPDLLKKNFDDLTPAQKISISQAKRHKARRDEKVPEIVKCIKLNGPSSFAAIAKTMDMTSGAVKNIIEENTDKFYNYNGLWALKNK